MRVCLFRFSKLAIFSVEEMVTQGYRAYYYKFYKILAALGSRKFTQRYKGFTIFQRCESGI